MKRLIRMKRGKILAGLEEDAIDNGEVDDGRAEAIEAGKAVSVNPGETVSVELHTAKEFVFKGWAEYVEEDPAAGEGEEAPARKKKSGKKKKGRH